MWRLTPVLCVLTAVTLLAGCGNEGPTSSTTDVTGTYLGLWDTNFSAGVDDGCPGKIVVSDQSGSQIVSGSYEITEVTAECDYREGVSGTITGGAISDPGGFQAVALELDDIDKLFMVLDPDEVDGHTSCTTVGSSDTVRGNITDGRFTFRESRTVECPQSGRTDITLEFKGDKQ